MECFEITSKRKDRAFGLNNQSTIRNSSFKVVFIEPPAKRLMICFLSKIKYK